MRKSRSRISGANIYFVECPTCAPNDCGLVQPEFSITCPDGNVLDECGCVQSCQCGKREL